MPNVRRAGLRLLNFWIERDVLKEFSALARKQGTSVSELLRQAIEQHLSEAGRENKKFGKGANGKRRKGPSQNSVKPVSAR
jgi:hypothetical protein